MKYNLIRFSLLIFIAAGLGSCKKDTLTEINPNEISTSTFWKNLTDTKKGLTSVYNAMLDEGILSIKEEAWRSDMGWPGFGRPLPIGNADARLIYYQTYTNSSGFVGAKWDACYKAIFWANQVIEALDKLKPAIKDIEQSEWNSQMGQARFVRGLMHFYLHSSFNQGKVIIQDKVPVSSEDFNKPLSTSDEVIAFFRADLNFAYENLPVTYTNLADLGRATKGAAATILGTSYLYQKDYPKATVYFKDVINNPAYKYELERDPKLLFTNAGEFNKESILELAYNSELRQDLGVFATGRLSQQISYYSVNSVGFLLPAWIIDAYKSEPMDTTDPRNYYVDPTSATGKTLSKISQRAKAMIAIVEDEQTIYYKTNNTPENARLTSNGWGFGYYKKYSNYDFLTAEGENDPRGPRSSGRNVVANRLADVYLMQAECFIKTGNLSGALDLINSVRNRWALRLLGPVNTKWAASKFDGINYTETSLMNQLMYIDKPLEMSVEGNAIRWNDLRRWGIIKSNFQNLASKTFYAIDYNYKDMNGVSKVKKQVSVLHDNPGGVTGDGIINYEYKDALNNYIDALHNYLPIPLTELMANSSLR